MTTARTLCAALISALLGAAAQAGGGGGGGGGDKAAAGPTNLIKANFTIESDTPNSNLEAALLIEDDPKAVSVPLVALPVSLDGQLSHYVFVSMRLMVADGQDPWRARERSHWVRDAIVRAAHRSDVVDAEGVLDEDRARAMVLEAVADVLSADALADVKFTQVNGGHRLTR